VRREGRNEKRKKTYQHFEHQDAESVPVDALVVSPRLHDFRCEVIGRTYEGMKGQSRLRARKGRKTNRRASR
jgi:hypothetical protein